MEILLFSLLTVVAAFVGTLAGFGISTVMVPVVALFFPLPVTLLFVGIIHLFGSIWKIILFRSGIRLKLIVTFATPALLASIIGAVLVSKLAIGNLQRILGIFLVAYVAYLFLHPKFRVPKTSLVTALGGIASGFAAGFFGIGGAIRSAFLTAYNFPKSVFIATNGVIALIVDLGRVGGYLSSGVVLPSHLFSGLILFIPLSFAGAELAKLAVGKISQRKFRIVVSLFLLVTGIRLILL